MSKKYEQDMLKIGKQRVEHKNILKSAQETH